MGEKIGRNWEEGGKTIQIILYEKTSIFNKREKITTEL